MKNLFISTLILFIAGLLLGCTEVVEKHESQALSKKAGNEDLVEITPSDISPAFTRNTVLELNAVVSRQLDLINEFDRIKRTKGELENADKDLNQAYVDSISGLSARAELNDQDLLRIKARLDKNGELYNRATLAGMVSFVNTVKFEIQGHLVSVIKEER